MKLIKNGNFILWLLPIVFLICNNYAQIFDQEKDDEFYCKSLAGMYKTSCKRCHDDDTCDRQYKNETGYFIKRCYCTNLELIKRNNDTVGGIKINEDGTAECKSTHPENGKPFCYVNWDDSGCGDFVGHRSNLGLIRQDRWMFDAYVSHEACEGTVKYGHRDKIGNELHLEGYKINGGEEIIPDEKPTSEFCLNACFVRNNTGICHSADFDESTKLCHLRDINGTDLPKEFGGNGLDLGQTTEYSCQTECLSRNGTCGSWSFNINSKTCYLQDSNACCGQFEKREEDNGFISGYLCPVCWSTKKKCPCTKTEREALFFLGDYQFLSHSYPWVPIQP